jgi:hypothetical protein
VTIAKPVRLLLWGLGVVGAVAGGLVFWAMQLEPLLRDSVNAFLREQALALIRNAEGDKLDITLGTFDFSLARGRLVIDTVAVVYDDSTDTEVERLRAHAPTVTLTGISVKDIVLRRRLVLSGVEIERPTLFRQESIHRIDSATTPAAPAAPAPRRGAPQVVVADTVRRQRALLNPEQYSLHGFGTELYSLVTDWVPRGLKTSRVELVKVDRANVTLVVGGPGVEQRTTVTDLVLELKGIGLDAKEQRIVRDVWISCPGFQLAWASTGRAANLHGIALKISAADSSMTVDSATIDLDANYRLRAWQVERSYAKHSFTTRRVALEPRLADAAFFRRARTRATRVRLDARDIQLAGMASGSTLVGQSVARRLEIGSLVIDAAVDKRFNAPRRRTWPVMPPQAFAALPWGINIDTLLLRGGEVRYTEIQANGEPSRINFSSLNARITRLANWDPTGPVEIAASARMYDAGVIRANFRIPVDPSRFSMDVNGTWAGMPLDRLNAFIIHSDGARITNGSAGEARFRFRIANRRSTGTLSPTWRDLKVELVNKESGKANLGKKIVSFVANTFVVRTNNAPGEKKYREDYPISYQLTRDDTFFGILWQSVRSAILPAMKK